MKAARRRRGGRWIDLHGLEDATSIEIAFAEGDISIMADLADADREDLDKRDAAGRRLRRPRTWSVWDSRFVRQGAECRASGLSYVAALEAARALFATTTVAEAERAVSRELFRESSSSPGGA